MSTPDVINSAIERASKFIEAGVDILDIGGESTRPGAIYVHPTEEINRVIPVIKILRDRFSIPLSIDTTKADVAREAVQAGATIINDVSGLITDPQMVDIVQRSKTHVVIMHSHQNQFIVQSDRGGQYRSTNGYDFVAEIGHDIEKMTLHAISHGVHKSRIIIDPGIGFGKTVEQNIQLIYRLDQLKYMGYPILLGASRKSFIGHATDSAVHKRLGGSIAAGVVGILKGADILRVHDVEETVQAAKLIDCMTRDPNCTDS